MLYAARCPQDIILVADMCPQSNLSQTLLNRTSSLSEGANTWRKLCLSKPPPFSKASQKCARTVAGYLYMKCNGTQWEAKYAPQFLFRVSDYNPNAPKNVYLLLGDGRLEEIAS